MRNRPPDRGLQTMQAPLIRILPLPHADAQFQANLKMHASFSFLVSKMKVLIPTSLSDD